MTFAQHPAADARASRAARGASMNEVVCALGGLWIGVAIGALGLGLFIGRRRVSPDAAPPGAPEDWAAFLRAFADELRSRPRLRPGAAPTRRAAGGAHPRALGGRGGGSACGADRGRGVPDQAVPGPPPDRRGGPLRRLRPAASCPVRCGAPPGWFDALSAPPPTSTPPARASTRGGPGRSGRPGRRRCPPARAAGGGARPRPVGR